jgi:hypothetical protein
VSPSFVDPARQSITVLSQENIPLPSSLYILKLAIASKFRAGTRISITFD